MKKNNYSSIETIINVAKKGGMYILVDDEKRENEGDLVMSTSDTNAKNINFMAKYGRGLICLALDSLQAKRFNLSLMSPVNQSRNQTAFTISIEAKKGITTGISAKDRARTIKIASRKNVSKKDIVSPGHVFPIIAKDGGVLVRAGHTEASDRGPVRQFLAEQSALLGIWIVGGTVPVMDSLSKPVARSLVYNPKGDCVGHYDKIHLFDAYIESETAKNSYSESDYYSHGKSIVTLPTEYCRLGLSVCYDLRFAELYQQLSQANAQVVTVPAAFTATTGRDHWELLLRARAVEQQFFVIGANLVDRHHSSRGLWGGSAIVDPWGTVLASLEDDTGVAVAEIDLRTIDQLRKRMPVQQHRTLISKY